MTTTAGMQQYSPHSPHSPAHAHHHHYSPHAHYGPGQQQQQHSPRTLDRRHTTSPSPSSSPRRTAFFPPPVPTSPSRAASPSQGQGRARARTEPSGYDGAGASQAPPLSHFAPGAAYQREVQQQQRALGHARKSSAYAALAALSGLASHPSTSTRHTQAHTQVQGAGGGTPGSTPPLSADVRDDYESEDEREQHEHEHEGSRERRGANGRLLTPPATPPRHSVLVVGEASGSGSGSGSEDSHEGILGVETLPHGDRPAFNARKASAQCRQLEGYVSFAAVEGLGEPPSPGPGGELEDDEDEAAKRKRGSLGAGIVGLWRGTFW
ncbi:hypothetical protein C8R46DRAFT_1283184 [Mycena filopes]|nr:hypothetical protein C8R46DRAFT_1283184 [Mycena filopes]